jgi:hypothetical protein
MKLPHEALLLRVFLGENARWKHQPLYEAIVLQARELHLAGATAVASGHREAGTMTPDRLREQ